RAHRPGRAGADPGRRVAGQRGHNDLPRPVGVHPHRPRARGGADAARHRASLRRRRAGSRATRRGAAQAHRERSVGGDTVFMSYPAPIAVALDAPSLDTAARWAGLVTPHVSTVKIGLELYLRYGAEAVASVRGGSSVRVFLDLKLNDIPATVAGAARA